MSLELGFRLRHYQAGERNYDVTEDGERFLMVRAADRSDSTARLNVVLSWYEEQGSRARELIMPLEPGTTLGH